MSVCIEQKKIYLIIIRTNESATPATISMPQI